MKRLIPFLLLVSIGVLALGQKRTIRGNLDVTGDMVVQGKLIDSLDIVDATTYNSIYIDKAGDDQTGDGSEGNPVASFRKAVELTEDYRMMGHNFFIGFGTYTMYWFGAGTWDWTEIQPYMNDHPARIVGVFLENVETFDVIRESDTAYIANITTPAFGDNTYAGYRCGGFSPILEHVSDTLVYVDLSVSLGSTDIKAPPTTIFNMDDLEFRVRNKLFSFIEFTSSGTDDMNMWYSDHVEFSSCDFNLGGGLWINEADKLRFTNCIFNLESHIYTGNQIRITFEHCLFKNTGGGSRDIDGFKYIGNFTDLISVSGIFDNFSSALEGNIGSIIDFRHPLYIRDSDNAFELDVYINKSNTIKMMYDLVVEDVTTVFNILTPMGYNIEVDDYKIIGTPPTISNKPVNVVDLSSDSYILVNKDTASYIPVVTTQVSASLTDGTPTDAEIDAALSTNPSTAGVGFTTTIKDSDGSGLLYRIESDGTNWQYQVLTIAL